jgi:hypothetical protein
MCPTCNGFRASIAHWRVRFFLAPKPILRLTCIWGPFWLHWAPRAKFWGVEMPKSSTWGSRPSRGRRMALPWPLVAFVVRFIVLLGAQMTTWAGGWSMGAGARGLPHLVLSKNDSRATLLRCQGEAHPTVAEACAISCPIRPTLGRRRAPCSTHARRIDRSLAARGAARAAAARSLLVHVSARGGGHAVARYATAAG